MVPFLLLLLFLAKAKRRRSRFCRLLSRGWRSGQQRIVRLSEKERWHVFVIEWQSKTGSGEAGSYIPVHYPYPYPHPKKLYVYFPLSHESPIIPPQERRLPLIWPIWPLFYPFNFNFYSSFPLFFTLFFPLIPLFTSAVIFFPHW